MKLKGWIQSVDVHSDAVGVTDIGGRAEFIQSGPTTADIHLVLSGDQINSLLELMQVNQEIEFDISTENNLPEKEIPGNQTVSKSKKIFCRVLRIMERK